MDQSTKDVARVAYDEEGARLERRSAKIQLYLLRVRIGFRLLDLCGAYARPFFSGLTGRVICAISLTDTLVEYYSTQGTCAPNNGPCAWFPPTQTMTYPSLVCLGAAYINLLLSAIVLIAYVWGTARADQWENTRGMFEKACTALKITLSSAAAGSMYANQSSSGTVQSLWGQACNPVTQANQLLTQIVNFDQFCTQQVHACGKTKLTRVAIGDRDARRASGFRRSYRDHICSQLLGGL